MGSRESRTSNKDNSLNTKENPPAAPCRVVHDSLTGSDHANANSVLLPLPEHPIPTRIFQPLQRRLHLIVRGPTLDPSPSDRIESDPVRDPLSTRPDLAVANKSDRNKKVLSSKKHYANLASSTGSAVPPLSPPPLQAPQTIYDSGVHFVRERTSFVRTQQTHPPSTHRFTVYVYIYELSDGMLAKHGRELMDLESSGVYHSAIVCYGMEFYFEGGIAIAGAGKTRIGTKYSAVRLGCTSVSLFEFLCWVRERERDIYQVHAYNIKSHNCHYFTRKAAEFLLGKAVSVPSYLYSTTESFFNTKKGAALQEVMSVLIEGSQYLIAEKQFMRVLEMQSGLRRLLYCLMCCRIPRQPPKVVVVFRVDDEKTCRATLDQILPYVEQLIDAKLVKPVARSILSCLTIELARGFDSVDPDAAQAFVDVITEALLHNPLALWGPLLNVLRVAILHHVVLTTVIFHSKLLSVLVFGSQEFLHLLPDGKLNLLRVICNLACGSNGAILLSDSHFLKTWVSLVGMGLMEPYSAIVYTASCLAVNIAISEVIWTIPSINNETPIFMGRSTMLSLLTITLYNLSHSNEKELPEPSFNMLLTCLLWFMTSGTWVLRFVIQHPFHPSYTDLLRRAQTTESCALILIIKKLSTLD